MTDPFSVLKNALEVVFYLESESMRNGKYTYTEIQQLKEATEHYNPNEKKTFIELVKTLRAAFHYVEKCPIDFASIKNSMDSLAKHHQMQAIDWYKFLSRSKVSPTFQFKEKEDKLIPWLNKKSGESFSQLDTDTQTKILLEHSESPGFIQILSTHLTNDNDPDFLFRIIMDSENNFIRLCQSKLILYLTDQQIAQAIIRHLPTLIQDEQNPMLKVEQLAHKINSILTKGRSLDTLLRNDKAKSILDDFQLFEIYQSDEYKNRHEPLSHEEKGDLSTDSNLTNLKI